MYRDNIILSKKYLAFFLNEYFDEYQSKCLEQLSGGTYRYCYLTDRNGCFELREMHHKFIDNYNCPLSIEYNFSQAFQMKYLIDIVQNIFKFIKVTLRIFVTP